MVSGGNEGSKEKKKLGDDIVYSRKSFKGLKTSESSSNLSRERQQKNQEMVAEGGSLSKRLGNSGFDAGSDNFLGINRDGSTVFPDQVNRVNINLGTKSKQERSELRRKLEGELATIRNLRRKIEGGNNVGGFKKGSGDKEHVAGQPRTKPLKQLNVSVGEGNQGENAEKEKRTPKANQFYRNSDFLLAKDRFPNKKSKPNGKKGEGSEQGNRSVPVGKFSDQLFKSCNALLDKLMKHKHGWVFNKPVDAIALGLHDYFDIIKHPMDLGTVKTKLNQKVYRSPLQFAEDVRLTFRNAMTYNPKEQDVHMMAVQLSKIFEDKWPSIEADYARELKNVVDFEVGPSPPTSKKPSKQSRPLPDMERRLERSESATYHLDPKQKSKNLAQSGRVAAPKKPKAKDPNKREMTYEEKQKLSINLQNLPSEKLENVVHIIRKRNSSLLQNDEEIEVDIDVVDNETLWELDRFVTNYKKSLSKNKRKSEITDQVQAEVEQNANEKIASPVSTGNPMSKTGEKSVSPAHPEKEAVSNTNRAPSPISSRTGSGSSSSDSGSGRSSGNGSDAGPSPQS